MTPDEDQVRKNKQAILALNAFSETRPLADHLEALGKTYVMQEQRTTHDAVLGNAGSSAGASSLKIELF